LTMTSNAENEKRGELAGRVDGRCWAEHTTEHDDLRRVAAIEFQPGLDCYKALCDAVDLDHEFSEMELKRYLFGDESAVLTNEYLAAFIEGARQFFLEGGASPRSNCAAGTAMPPNFALLNICRPDVARLVAAMVQARDAVEHRTWSHPQEPTGEEWWADVLADPRARKRERRTDLAVKKAFYRLADEKRLKLRF
jgi:hypothetical protein